MKISSFIEIVTLMAIMGNILCSVIVLGMRSISPYKEKQLYYLVAWLTNILAVIMLIISYKTNVFILNDTMNILLVVFTLLGSIFFLLLFPKDLLVKFLKK